MLKIDAWAIYICWETSVLNKYLFITGHVGTSYPHWVPVLLRNMHCYNYFINEQFVKCSFAVQRSKTKSSLMTGAPYQNDQWWLRVIKVKWTALIELPIMLEMKLICWKVDVNYFNIKKEPIVVVQGKYPPIKADIQRS